MKIHKNTYIGFFAIVVLVILIWGISFLKGLSLFQAERNYYVVYEKVGGLQRSSAIMLKGYQVGQVQDIYFDTIDYQSIIVKLMVDQDIKIPLNSEARIVSSDLMGTKEIQFIFSESDSLHALGDTLKSGIEKELSEEVNAQIAPLKAKAEELISSFDSVLVGVNSVFTENTRESLRKTFLEINNTIKNLTVITEELSIFVENEMGHVANTFGNIDSVSQTLKANSGKIDNIISNLSVFSDSLSTADIASTIKEAESAFKEINMITEKINAGEGSLGLLINDEDLYLNMEKSTKELEILLKDIRENPKRYLNVSVFGGRKSGETNTQVE